VLAVLDKRSCRIGPLLFDMSMYQLSGSIKPTLASDDNQVVQWPILFLYDEVSQSDFVESYDERNELVDQMQLMFPADRPVDWDEDGKYS